ncbi:MAG: GNAT family N-acetyltransferase [Lachnospiraceae bacterium]|nr:GNAT family N-acetyltransferase [Lachnospiraceae bacterium]MBD5482083.1 GNAT family N-acetyltransferase [Lachnospiraceae bacterium]
MNMSVTQIADNQEKRSIARQILEALPDWFGIPEAREEYISGSAGNLFFAAYDGERPIGFLYLKETGKSTVELAVMGVRKEYHRQGIGRELFGEAKKAACEAGYAFMQVKTVQMGRYEEYDRTNRFYLAVGFREFEVFPTLWDECNPCQIYVMALG